MEPLVHSTPGIYLFLHKLSAGSVYHLALASGLQRIGFEIGEVGKNGIFEIVGVPTHAWNRHQAEPGLQTMPY
jgi:hypothetical protein